MCEKIQTNEKLVNGGLGNLGKKRIEKTQEGVLNDIESSLENDFINNELIAGLIVSNYKHISGEIGSSKEVTTSNGIEKLKSIFMDPMGNFYEILFTATDKIKVEPSSMHRDIVQYRQNVQAIKYRKISL